MCAAPARFSLCQRRMFVKCLVFAVFRCYPNIIQTYSWAFNSMNERTTNKIMTAIKSEPGGCGVQSVYASHAVTLSNVERLLTTVTASYIRFKCKQFTSWKYHFNGIYFSMESTHKFC